MFHMISWEVGESPRRSALHYFNLVVHGNCGNLEEVRRRPESARLHRQAVARDRYELQRDLLRRGCRQVCIILRRLLCFSLSATPRGSS